jgi:hypothetical protein
VLSTADHVFLFSIHFKATTIISVNRNIALANAEHIIKESAAYIMKNITIVNDTSRVIRRDALSCGITYGHHSDNSRGAIYTSKEHL